MCGIAGRFNFDDQPVDRRELNEMCLTLAHRGPDNQGVYVKDPVGLGSRRLSIIDLSAKGNQPISNETKTVWVVNNGEIYNFKELRSKLINQGHKFRSKTDTEVIVHLWEEHGVKCLDYLRGMFALALWDEKQKVLFLARDRLGQKPLKYYLTDKEIVFASEIKAILKTKGIKKQIDLRAVDLYFNFEAVLAPLTGFKGIKKLSPASYLLVKNNKVSIKKYWQLEFLPKHQLNEGELKKELIKRLTESVKLRLVADVPVGAFLSGGVDSSAVVALMSGLGHKQLNTFSVGFSDKQYSELKYARVVAKKFKTNHHEAVLKPQSFSLLPKLAKTYEEPFGDPSALPSYLVSQLAGKKLKVVLNGDGGDDILAGYQRHKKLVILSYLSKLGLGQYTTAFSNWQAPVSFKRKLYNQDFLNEINLGASQKLALKYKNNKLGSLDNILMAEMNTYLANVLLPKVDIASMSQGLEVRSPFLDQELVEFVSKIPAQLKLRWGESKYILKKALEGILPNEIIYRKKMGFGFPLGSWLRNQWKKDISRLLLSKKAMTKDYLNQEVIKTMINQPLKGEHHDRRLWRILMFELWLQHYFAK